MPIKKKKISDLSLADSLRGLYTIGYKVVDGVKTSVKVSLEYIQVAYEDVVKATNDAIAAAKTAFDAATAADTSRKAIEANEAEREGNEDARKASEQERSAAEIQRGTAETGRVNAENIRVSEFGKLKTDSEKATGDANNAANRVDESIHDAEVATGEAQVATAGANQAAIGANQSAANADAKATLADTAAANANDTANHPTYIGTDHYVYKWNKTTKAYDKTDIYCKGDAFSIKKVYASVAALNADVNSADIAEGDFVLVNTNDVENPDNAKLYVKVKSDTGVFSYEFLVDMSGAIGFTGKTPQFSMGNISTLEAGSTATATVSEDGTDSNGNPRYKINFAIPSGNPGAPFRVAGEYATLAGLQAAVPNGANIDGFMAVGTKVPYNYYAWVNGAWKDQGQIAGGGGNIVKIPIEVFSLADNATSTEIFNAFGGKKAYMEICQKVYEGDVVCVIANTPSDSQNVKISYTSMTALSLYVDNDNANLQLSAVTDTLMIFTFEVTNGVATKASDIKNMVFDAPSDGKTYGRKNKNWTEVPEKTDVLTKTNTTVYTPTGDYNPATKKYVDDKMYVINNNTFFEVLRSNKNINGTEVKTLIAKLFGSYDSYRYFLRKVNENVFTSLKFSDFVYDDVSGDWYGNSYIVSNLYVYWSNMEGYFHCGFTYRWNTKLKSCEIYVYESTNHNDDILVVKDLVSSENITTITRYLTQAEYDALSTKDSSTLYIIID